MTNLTSDEREPTITTGGESLSIFEIMQRYRNDGSCEHVIEDALRRLSLIGSQAAGSDDERLDAMLKKSGILHTCHRPHDSGTALERLARNVSDLAATRMRDKCVAVVRALPDHAALCGVWLQQTCSCSFRAEAIKALESLTLDQVEQETK